MRKAHCISPYDKPGGGQIYKDEPSFGTTFDFDFEHTRSAYFYIFSLKTHIYLVIPEKMDSDRDVQQYQIKRSSEECNICLTEQTLFMANVCNCIGFCCITCFKKTEYKCPFCRAESNIRIRKNTCRRNLFTNYRENLSVRDRKKAVRNWGKEFKRRNGLGLIRRIYPNRLFHNYEPIHRILQTGDFGDRLQAGICVSEEAAQNYVVEQLNTFAYEHNKCVVRFRTKRHIFINQMYIFYYMFTVYNELFIV